MSIPKLRELICFAVFAVSGVLTGLTPDEALTRLKEGNARYVKDKTVCPDRQQERREALVSNQAPFAVILGCSDSRVAPEIIFDQGVGDLFVVRVAGNVVGPIEMDSIDYAVRYLGASLIVVLGHENCGALKTVLEGHTQEIEAIAMQMSREVLEAKSYGKDALTWLIKRNVADTVERIRTFAPSYKRINEGKLNVVGAYYQLGTGEVSYLPTK